MAKKKNQPQEAQPVPAEAPKKLYSVSLWRGIKEVYKCEQCGTFRDTKDEIFDHILLHYPANKQEEILDQLIQEQ